MNLNKLLITKGVYIIGFILLIGVLYVGYNSYFRIGYIDYIPSEMEKYKNFIYKVENGNIDDESIVFKLFGLMPQDDNVSLKEEQAITATVLTLIEKFPRKMELRKNEQFCMIRTFLAVGARGIKELSEEKKRGFRDLEFLRQKCLQKLEQKHEQIINQCNYFELYNAELDFFEIISELNEKLDLGVYSKYSEGSEKTFKKILKTKQSQIKELQEDIKQLENKGVVGEELKEKKNYLEYLKREKTAIEKRIEKIRENFQKAGV
jgi:hypothetical protein